MHTHKLLWIVVLLVVGTMVSAQDDTAIELEAFTDETFSVQGVIPAGWDSIAPGVYARGATDDDFTRLIIQSAPLSEDALVNTLAGQLGVELPEADTPIETDHATWTAYQFTVEDGVMVGVTLATATINDTAYLILLQSPEDEHESLRESVFFPVLQSLNALGDDTEETSQDMMVAFTEEDITFSSDDLTLEGTVTLPDSEAFSAPYPAVVIVSGSGAQERDGSLAPLAEITLYADIAHYLAEIGIASLRYDERGVGASDGEVATATLENFRDDASAAVDALAEREDTSRIGAMGHSEGGIFMPELAISNENIDFVVGLNAPTLPMQEVLQEQNRLLYSASGATDEQVDAIVVAWDAIIAAIDSEDTDAFEEAITALVNAQTNNAASEQQITAGIAQFNLPIFQSYFAYNPTPFWEEVDVPALAIFGTLDLQVSAEQNRGALENLGNDNITLITVEDMNHIFQIAETGSIAEYGTLEQTVSLDLLEPLAEWINALASDS
ncbi:MAG: alpha/beta fold hydrolase [Chloroflexota bacterium]